jgi:integrase
MSSHYLLRSPSGIYYLRLRVPRALQPSLGLRVVKRSLHTRDAPTARACAQLLRLRYAQAFAVIRGANMPKLPEVSDLVSSLQGQGKAFEAEFDPVTRGLTRMKTDGTEQDNAAALAFAQQLLAQPVASGETSARKRSQFVLSAAVRVYNAAETKDAPETTRRHREAAVHSFVEHMGANKYVADITRPMAAEWAQKLIDEGVTKRTAANYVSKVAQIFEMLIERGELETNPVKGVLVMSLKEKRARKDLGYTWEPFELADLKRIFDPQNYRKLKKPHAFWGPLIGLYTGARVAEVAQLFLRDFVVVEGHPCLRIYPGSDGQSVKNDASKRLVPLHPDLIRLGLLDRVHQMKERGVDRLFPDMRIDSAAGAGNSISKAFSYYLAGLSIKPRRKNGTIGFHSLRKNVIQALQGSKLLEERRRAFVGHEGGDNGDVHAEVYMRPWKPEELAELFPGLKWGEWLDVDALRARV